MAKKATYTSARDFMHNQVVRTTMDIGQHKQGTRGKVNHSGKRKDSLVPYVSVTIDGEDYAFFCHQIEPDDSVRDVEYQKSSNPALPGIDVPLSEIERDEIERIHAPALSLKPAQFKYILTMYARECLAQAREDHKDLLNSPHAHDAFRRPVTDFRGVRLNTKAICQDLGLTTSLEYVTGEGHRVAEYLWGTHLSYIIEKAAASIKEAIYSGQERRAHSISASIMKSDGKFRDLKISQLAKPEFMHNIKRAVSINLHRSSVHATDDEYNMLSRMLQGLIENRIEEFLDTIHYNPDATPELPEAGQLVRITRDIRDYRHDAVYIQTDMSAGTICEVVTPFPEHDIVIVKACKNEKPILNKDGSERYSYIHISEFEAC